MKAPSRCLWLLWGALVLLAAAGRAADEEPAFEKTSLAWRTALHFDPGAVAPLNSLAQLYQGAGRLNDLLALYAEHVARFPTDEGARVVLARLYVLAGDARAESFIKEAVAAHPQNPLLAYALGTWMQSKLDPGALDMFDRAVALETQPARQALWLGDLLKKAALVQRQDLVIGRFKELAKKGAFAPLQRLQWARQALDLGFAQAAAAVLEGEGFDGLAGDEWVEACFTRARVALANGNRAEASRIVHGLLEKLAADHWRYREALTLRWEVSTDAAERARMLGDSEKAWKAAPDSEPAALAYGDLLLTSDLRGDALRVWREALLRIPSSRLLEERILNLMEQSHQDDDLLAFLAERLKLQPEREDLALRRARALLVLGRQDEGIASLHRLLGKADSTTRVEALLQTARWLRLRQLFGEAARVLESLLALEPQRWEARKELAELYLLLKRQDDMERLFAQPMAESVPGDVRLETAQFLVGQKMWSQAMRLLQGWVGARPGEFDGRLLLAKVKILLGDDAAAGRLLEECRTLSDSDARYAAWLSLAWEHAQEAGTTAEFLDRERSRLWPPAGVGWDLSRLAKLSLLAQQTMQQKERGEGEALVRKALAAPGLPDAERRDLRLQLIQYLDGQSGREKELETELLAALREPGAAKGDLQMRLTLMYHGAKRPDLARAALAEVDPAACQDAVLLGRVASVAAEMGAGEMELACDARLVRLQPEERAHWNRWTTLLMQSQDETTLRLALREAATRSKAWKLSSDAQDLLRRHLAASYWRSVARLLAGQDTATQALPLLNELERAELSPQRRLWAAWARGFIARKAGMASPVEKMQKLLGSGVDGFVDFPDGLSLSLQEARRLLADNPASSLSGPNKRIERVVSARVLPPLELNWAFSTGDAAVFQRWDLSADGKAVLASDNRNRLYLIDQASGRLLWRRLMPRPADGPPPPAAQQRSDEQISYPPEWVISAATVCVSRDQSLFCLSLRDGSLLWQVEPAGGKGETCLAWDGGRVLAWNAAEGRLDAMDELSGKILWTRKVPQLAEVPKFNPQSPQWLAMGIHATDGKVLIWANGAAVLSVADGALLWRATVGPGAPAFPLELSPEDDSSKGPPPLANAAVVPWMNVGFPGFRGRRGSGVFSGRMVYANALAAPGYGYPGMYGNMQPNPWVLWGADQRRWLQGDGIWTLGPSAIQRFSVLGLPTSRNQSGGNFDSPAWAVGFAGRSLIAATRSAVIRCDPEGASSTLWSNRRGGDSSQEPLAASALTGRTLLLATKDTLRIQDTGSGTVLWEGPWPEAAVPLVKAASESMEAWSSVRWTSRGVFLSDGNGRTLTVDWKGLSAQGVWVVPVGTQTLVGLRGTGS